MCVFLQEVLGVVKIKACAQLREADWEYKSVNLGLISLYVKYQQRWHAYVSTNQEGNSQNLMFLKFGHNSESVRKGKLASEGTAVTSESHLHPTECGLGLANLINYPELKVNSVEISIGGRKITQSCQREEVINDAHKRSSAIINLLKSRQMFSSEVTAAEYRQH